MTICYFILLEIEICFPDYFSQSLKSYTFVLFYACFSSEPGEARDSRPLIATCCCLLGLTCSEENYTNQPAKGDK